MKNLLKGLKVVELASVLAGPSVGMFFAELGAEVIKIENAKSNGDVTRSWKLASEDKEHPFSAYYSSVNWGKKSLFIDLKKKEDYQKLLSQIQKADVLLVNFKPGDALRYALDYDSIKKLNPHIIYGEITGFPNSKRTAYDVVLQAECGFMYMNGSPKGSPLKMPVAFIDLFAAHQLKEGILLALLQHQKKKQSIQVSVSLYESALSALANQAMNWLMAQHIPQALGSLHPNIAPYGESFITKDKKLLVLAIGNEGQFQRLCKLLALEYLIEDERFKFNQERVKNRKTLAKFLAEKISLRDREPLLNQMILHNIPAGAVRNMEEVFQNEEAQKHILEEEKEGRVLKAVRGNAFNLKFG